MNEANAANPMFGIFLFMLGGLSGAVFYLPFSKVKKWAWESFWLIYALMLTGVLSYLIGPPYRTLLTWLL